MTVDEAAALLGISRGSAYEGVRTGRLPSIRASARRIVVPRAALEKMLAAEPNLVSGGPGAAASRDRV
jgi:excisionase family DNA binding protein